MSITIKRAYDPPSKSDGFRILVDRLWPRGVKKEALHADLWLKEVAPSTELRKWFGHDPARWPEFEKKYTAELKGNGECVNVIRKHAARGAVTLVYSAKDEEHNQAVVLKRFLERSRSARG